MSLEKDLNYYKEELLKYALENNYDKYTIKLIKECDDEYRLQMCLNIAKKSGLEDRWCCYLLLTD